MNNKRIAYSLCGEGFGHYGRSIGIIKSLAKRFPECQIDVYCYDYTYDMMSKDGFLPSNITVNRNIGMRMAYNRRSKISFLKTMVFNKRNYVSSFKVLGLEMFRIFVKPIADFFDKKNTLTERYTKKYVNDFDFAIVDYEPLLPRIAKTRKKKFITVDSINLLLCADFRGFGFNGKDWFYRMINMFLTKLYAPLSNPAIITTICDYPLKKKYRERIIKVGPLVRKEISELAVSVIVEDFILVYVRNSVRNKILPVLKEVEGHRFVVFTENLSEEEKQKYQAPWIEFYEADPVSFPDYLRRCKAIISTSGYTLITEAMVLKKPFYAVSIGGVLAFEQRLSLNALKNSKCGDGCAIRKFNQARLTHFLSHIGDYDKILKDKNFQDDTEEVAGMISSMIQEELQLSDKGK